MIEDNARDVPTWSSRSASTMQSIAKALEELQSALQKSGIDCATTILAHRGGVCEVEHWDEAVRCLSVDPVLSGCVAYMGRVQ